MCIRDSVKERAFERDWRNACEKHNLSKKIARTAKKLEDAEMREECTPDVFKAAICEFSDIIYQVFAYYCCFGGSDDIFSMNSNSFIQLVRDCNLSNNDVEGLRDADLQLMFEAANVRASKDDDAFDSKHSLDREEFVTILTEIILRKHIEGHHLTVEEAVKRFFIEDIACNVPSVCLQDSNCCLLYTSPSPRDS